MRVCTWVVIVLCLIVEAATVLESFLICHPSAAMCNPNVGGNCKGQNVSYIVLEVVALVLDIAILILPLSTIPTMRMRSETKRKSMVIFSMGALWV